MIINRFRLTTAGPVTAVLVLLIAFAIFGVVNTRLGDENAQRSIRAISNPITITSAKLLFNPLYKLDVAETNKILAGYVDGKAIVFAAVYDSTGKRVTTVSSTYIPDEATSATVALRSITQNAQVEQLTGQYLILTTPIQTGNETIGAVEFIFDQTVVRSTLGSSQLQILLAIAAILIGTVTLFFYLIRSAVAPLVSLSGIAQKIGAGDLGVTIPLNGAQEITLLAQSLESMRVQLQATVQRVENRTKALATSTEVSRRLSTILNEKELVTEVVGQVNTAFGYYHTQIYFYDEANENLVMAGGTGEAGEKMLAQGHKITKGRGLVGRAAESNETVLVSDTSQDPEWLANPLLSDTKAEIAIPISIGDQVLGILDVQHNITEGLKQEDVDSLQSIANQVAVALQNTRQYRDSQQFKMGIENAGDAVFVTDIKGTITYANPTFEKVYGFALSEVIGNTPRIIKSGLLTMENYQAFWEALLSKNSITGEIVNRHKDGHLVYIAGTNSAIVNDAGEITGFLAVHHDITEQRKNQELATQHAKQQESLNLITQKIQNTTSIEAALQIAAREIGRSVGKETHVMLAATEQKDGRDHQGDSHEQ